MSGNAYYRHLHTSTFNGDINDDSLDQSVYQPGAAELRALAAAGYTGFPASGATASNTPFPSWRCIGNVLLNDEPGEKCNGLLNRSETAQNNYGVSGQLTRHDWPTARNTFVLGVGYDAGRSMFEQSTQLGYLNPDRTITGLNAFADGGVTGGNVDGVPYDNRVGLDGHNNTGSIFASDVLPIGSAWYVTLSARYNHTSISNTDGLTPAGAAGSLTGDHGYGRLNPAAGVTFSPTRAVNLYAGYSEGSRAPTSIELGCADSNEPVQAAQCPGRRSTAGAGGHQNRGSRNPWRARHPHVERRRIPRRQSRRHPVRSVSTERIRVLQEFRQHTAARI